MHASSIFRVEHECMRRLDCSTGPDNNRIAFSFYSGGEMTTQPESVYFPLVAWRLWRFEGLPRVTGISEADSFFFRFHPCNRISSNRFLPNSILFFEGNVEMKMKIRVKNPRMNRRTRNKISITRGIGGELFVSKYRSISRACI